MTVNLVSAPAGFKVGADNFKANQKSETPLNRTFANPAYACRISEGFAAKLSDI
jgi:hypothetical protein